MKGKSNGELFIEAEGVTERISGKKFVSFSTEDRSADVFIEADGDSADFTIAVLFGWLFLINRKKNKIKTTGYTIFRRIYFFPGKLVIHIEELPLIISWKGNDLPPSPCNIAYGMLLTAAALCFILSSYVWFLPVKKGRSKSFPNRQSFPMIKNYSEMPLRKDGLNYFHLKDILLNIQNTEKRELEKALKALALSKVIYEKKGIDKGVRITGRAIGGINRILKEKR